MTITFVSNYINHHQIPFSNACYAGLGENYHFIQTEPMEEERVAMGWGAEVGGIPYVKYFYEEEAYCRKLLAESDVVIFGWIQREDLLDVTAVIEERLRNGKPSLRVSERLYREGQWKAVSPRGLKRKYRDHTRFRKEQVGLLCAGPMWPPIFILSGHIREKCSGSAIFRKQSITPGKNWRERKRRTESCIWYGRDVSCL